MSFFKTCFWMHLWNKWGEPQQDQSFKYIFVLWQERRCSRCNLVQRHRL